MLHSNLKLGLAKAPFDAVAIQESTNVWIDHNTFANDLSHDKDFYDGLLDITHAADFVTVSWNVFTTSFKTSLIGHSASNGKEDKGHLRVTYHHNYFVNVSPLGPTVVLRLRRLTSLSPPLRSTRVSLPFDSEPVTSTTTTTPRSLEAASTCARELKRW